MDPTDGKQAPGRRLRAYAVLADVLARKGDEDHANFYRGAVTAVRLSENADRFFAAGLLTQAAKLYDAALTHFTDAYCIQFRLASRLSELGDNAEAEEHYRRAYELMPESFGRVESFCFGCQRPFATAEEQNIAEKVFMGLAAKMPDNPQVHYVLGNLRMQQKRAPDAFLEFKKAVVLDPDYLNAWKEIGEIGKQMHIPTKLRDEVAINEIRLDPLQRHIDEPDTAEITNLAGVWNAACATKDLFPAVPGPLLTLTASARELPNATSDPCEYGDNTTFNYKRGKSPAECIAANRFISAVSAVFGLLQRAHDRE